VLHKGNPHMNCQFVNNTTLIASGFDKVPFIYKLEGSQWKQTAVLDEGINKSRVAKITGNAFLDKKAHFNNDIKLDSSVMMKETDTKHLNYINCLKVFAGT
jgi:NDP-sugar pyrophosphorylase family protein